MNNKKKNLKNSAKKMKKKDYMKKKWINLKIIVKKIKKFIMYYKNYKNKPRIKKGSWSKIN